MIVEEMSLNFNLNLPFFPILLNKNADPNDLQLVKDLEDNIC